MFAFHCGVAWGCLRDVWMSRRRYNSRRKTSIHPSGIRQQFRWVFTKWSPNNPDGLPSGFLTSCWHCSISPEQPLPSFPYGGPRRGTPLKDLLGERNARSSPTLLSTMGSDKLDREWVIGDMAARFWSRGTYLFKRPFTHVIRLDVDPFYPS